jgi:HEAT repeat protein
MPTPDLGMPPPIAVIVVLMAITLFGYAWRALERHRRRQTRRTRADLAHLLQSFVDGGTPAAELRRAIDDADAGTAWTVLEAHSLRLDRAAWLRLSAALRRSRHAAAERRALADDSPWRRALAARHLGLLRSRVSWRALRRAMRSGPELVTHATAMSLARYRDRGALRWLLAHPAALARRARPARLAVLRAFGRAGLPVIAEALAGEIEDGRLEIAMIEALGLGRHRGAHALIERRLSDQDVDLRVAAARALGRMHAVECATALIGALKDREWPVRAQAARALGRVRAPLATHALAARLTDPSWWVRRHAAYALMELGEDGQATLRHVAASSPDPYARDMAREALEGGIHRRSA